MKTVVFFLFCFFHLFAQNIDCGYSIEPPRQGGSHMYQQSMLRAKIRKKYEKIHFYNQFFFCILHGRVFVMSSPKVQVGKDQEKAQSEKDSHSKNRGGKKTKLTIRYLYHETYRKPNEQLFSQ